MAKNNKKKQKAFFYFKFLVISFLIIFVNLIKIFKIYIIFFILI